MSAPRPLDAESAAELRGSLGSTVHRFPVDWRWVERQPGVFSWGLTDELYQADLARGIRPILVLLFAPSWTLEGACNQWAEECTHPPTRRFDWAWRRIAGELAARYPQAAGIELWNEPNLSSFWSPQPDAARYTELLRIGHDAIKRVNPSMPVLTGGFANTQLTGRGADGAINVSLRDFLRQVYQAGGGPYMDGIAFHAFPRSRDDSRFHKSFMDVREIRESFGDDHKPLWVTEVGLSTTGPAGPELMSEDDQARGLRHLLRLITAMPDVDAVLFHTLVEPAGDRSGSQEPGYGIIRRDGRAKPAVCALAAERQATFRCPPGVAAPAADVRQEHRWEAQAYLHAALEAARAYRRDRGTFKGLDQQELARRDARVSPAAPPEPASPGADADPRRIAVYLSSGADEALLCNASRGDYSYCAMTGLDDVRYGKAASTTWGVADATTTGASRSW